jgi:hypothetical protein
MLKRRRGTVVQIQAGREIKWKEEGEEIGV